MNILFGSIITGLSAFAFIGQIISVLWPGAAAKMGLMEREAEVDPAFYADVKGEAIWDAIILWPLPLAGGLLIAGIPTWAFFGLVGGGIYLYFAGRGIIVRIVMLRQGIRIGGKDSLAGIFTFLVLWGVSAILAIVLAVRDLSTL